VADVGQSDWEEIDWVEAGKNYGWDVMEGTHCYEPSTNCGTSGLELPIFEYSHDVGNSITGGHVYEGWCAPLQNQYVYGDYGSGRIWTLSYDNSGVIANDLLIDSPLSLTTFGTGPDDGLFFAGIFDDALYKFVCSTIPVELVAFTGRFDGSDVTLKWQTASETNNAGFQIQRKREGESDAPVGWSKIGFVEGNGTTSQMQSYRFVDKDPSFEAQTLTYRLQQIDTDGSTSYSDEITVRRNPGEVALFDPVPNPARQQVTVRYAVPEETDASLRLFDALGRQVRIVQNRATTGRRKARLDISDLSNGVYVLRLRAGGIVRTQTTTVVK